MMFRIVRARLVLPQTVLRNASLLVEGGRIESIEADSGRGAPEVDVGGAWVLPGLVDLHSDAIEKWLEPRPNVRFGLALAIAQADWFNALCGITTPFHSISFADGELGLRSRETALALVEALERARTSARLDHRCHCRYEVTDPGSLEPILDLMAARRAHLVSFMDHTPGRGQFKSDADYQQYLVMSSSHTRQQADLCVVRKRENAEGAPERIWKLAEAARRHGIPLAAHDEDTPSSIPFLKQHGVRICEFPVNLPTARAARDAGLNTVFGAPNILRGASQCGSVRALDAVRENLADCLCSDYMPAALLNAIFMLARTSEIGIPEAVRLGTLSPAQAVGLTDRGSIEVTKRADLLAVTEEGDVTCVRRVWVNGRSVAELAPPEEVSQ